LLNVQMYGLHYYGIANNVGLHKLKSLAHKAKSLDMKDFLFGNSPYMGNYIKPVTAAILRSSDEESSPPPARSRDGGPQQLEIVNAELGHDEEDRHHEDLEGNEEVEDFDQYETHLSVGVARRKIMKKKMNPRPATELPTMMTILTLGRRSRERQKNRLLGGLELDQVAPAVVLLIWILESKILPPWIPLLVPLHIPLLLGNSKEQRRRAILVLLHYSKLGTRKRRSLRNLVQLSMSSSATSRMMRPHRLLQLQEMSQNRALVLNRRPPLR
jgi:hypothetical protein